ncbi:hypothetical protein A6E15_16830 [Natrinema saccharevitans]|uniref:Uncharacterized protein n=1 Tax=Natrinema saccharevitans TaxID=301967 RepID=A0A1S8B0G3_9EURY|nr:hypothetical protein [Natrinema saccharevitans]OLZ42523.1 hypothetical protein A6E15_16830 [Natrinema saccharevitans]
MANVQGDRAAAWTDRVEQLCDEGERIAHRADLEAATLVVTNRRLLAFTPDRGGRNFRAVDRPNVGTVAVESTDRLAWLGLSLAAAFVGVGLLEAARAVSLGDLVPVEPPSAPALPPVSDLVGAVREGVGTALLVLEWGAVALAVTALVLAVALFGAYVRSRSRRLVIRVSGGADLAVPVTDTAVEDGVVADLEAAIRPNPIDGHDEDRRGEGHKAGPDESG